MFWQWLHYRGGDQNPCWNHTMERSCGNCLHLLKATCSTGYTGFLCEVGKVSRKCRKSMFRYPLLHTIETVSTYSRLHVLLGILDSCVKWEKSAENAVSQCLDIHYYTPQKLPLPTQGYMFYWVYWIPVWSGKSRQKMPWVINVQYPLLHTIETVSTYSRLHVLLGILDSCVKWEKSAENAVSQCSDIHYYTQ